jgi:hypothetical protein
VISLSEGAFRKNLNRRNRATMPKKTTNPIRKNQRINLIVKHTKLFNGQCDQMKDKIINLYTFVRQKNLI